MNVTSWNYIITFIVVVMNVSCAIDPTLKCFPGVRCLQRQILPPNSSLLPGEFSATNDQMHKSQQVSESSD